jgi:hypothetical protein
VPEFSLGISGLDQHPGSCSSTYTATEPQLKGALMMRDELILQFASQEADTLYTIVPTLKHDGPSRPARGEDTSRSVMAVRSFGFHASSCDRGRSISHWYSQDTNIFQFTVFVFLLCLYNYFLHPIAHIKGPFLAAVSPVSLSSYSSLLRRISLTDW